MFDYQSDRHRSKTRSSRCSRPSGLITSQIDTAPKLVKLVTHRRQRLITSQIDTAPKLRFPHSGFQNSLITSQIDTAPKRIVYVFPLCVGLITSQIDTAPKLLLEKEYAEAQFDYQSDRHRSKTSLTFH